MWILLFLAQHLWCAVAVSPFSNRFLIPKISNAVTTTSYVYVRNEKIETNGSNTQTAVTSGDNTRGLTLPELISTIPEPVVEDNRKIREMPSLARDRSYDQQVMYEYELAFKTTEKIGFRNSLPPLLSTSTADEPPVSQPEPVVKSFYEDQILTYYSPFASIAEGIQVVATTITAAGISIC